jgi:hypothetical protein
MTALKIVAATTAAMRKTAPKQRLLQLKKA